MINITGVFHDQRRAGQSFFNIGWHHHGNRRLQRVTPTCSGTCIESDVFLFKALSYSWSFIYPQSWIHTWIFLRPNINWCIGQVHSPKRTGPCKKKNIKSSSFNIVQKKKDILKWKFSNISLKKFAAKIWKIWCSHR